MLIERIVQQFANKYYADNANSYFANSDAAFILAYSTIMLATDQYGLFFMKVKTILIQSSGTAPM